MPKVGGTLVAILTLAAPIPASRAIAASATLAIPGGRMRIDQRGASTALSGVMAGRRFRLTLPAQDGIYPRSFDSAKLVGAVADRFVILSVDYASRPGNPNGECGAGTETVLRVIALRPPIRQTFAVLVESCWNNIEQTSVAWDAAAAVLTTDLATAKGDVVTRYRIAPDGAVTAIGSPERR